MHHWANTREIWDLLDLMQVLIGKGKQAVQASFTLFFWSVHCPLNHSKYSWLHQSMCRILYLAPKQRYLLECNCQPSVCPDSIMQAFYNWIILACMLSVYIAASTFPHCFSNSFNMVSAASFTFPAAVTLAIKDVSALPS